MVSIPGGEPLLHSQIGEFVQGLIQRRKYVHRCTNAIKLKEALDGGWFKPSKYLTFSVHMDGERDHHDFAVCREDVFDKATEAIRVAVLDKVSRENNAAQARFQTDGDRAGPCRAGAVIREKQARQALPAEGLIRLCRSHHVRADALDGIGWAAGRTRAGTRC